MPSINGVMMQYFHWYVAGDGSLWYEAARAGEGARRRPVSPRSGFLRLQGNRGRLRRGLRRLRHVRPRRVRPEGLGAAPSTGRSEQYLARGASPAAARGSRCTRDVVLNHRMGGDAIEIVTGHALRPGRPHCVRRTCLRDDRGLHPLPVPRPAGTVLVLRVARARTSMPWTTMPVGPTRRTRSTSSRARPSTTRWRSSRATSPSSWAADLDFQSEEVRHEVTDWGKWYLDTTGVDGFRLDAVKHIAAWFFPEWLDAMKKHAGKDLFVVGEYWTPERGRPPLVPRSAGRRACSLFGGAPSLRLPLREPGRRPLRHAASPRRLAHARFGATVAVTFVDNHDSQPLQALESSVEPWFKPLAYAIILLRARGLSLRLLSRLLRRLLRRPGARRPAAPGGHALHRFLIDVFLHAATAPRPRAPVRLLRPREPRRLDSARRRAAPEGYGRADERRAGGHEMDGGRKAERPLQRRHRARGGAGCDQRARLGTSFAARADRYRCGCRI